MWKVRAHSLFRESRGEERKMSEDTSVTVSLRTSDERRWPASSRLPTPALLVARRLTLALTNHVCALTCLAFFPMDDVIMKTKIEPYFVIDFRGT